MKIYSKFTGPTVVAINRFPDDAEAELGAVRDACRARQVDAFVSDVWAQGGAGALDLADAVVRLCGNEPPVSQFAYDAEDALIEKITKLATRIYRASAVELTPVARKQLAALEANGFGRLPVCMAKTQYSFSDNPTLLGAPDDFTLTVRELRVSAGAGFVVCLTGDVMTMPGLPKRPAAERIDVDASGRVSGLF